MDINISGTQDWLDIWKLRILVLVSTVIQLFLLMYGSARRAPVARWLRVCIWLAYLAGDSLAIYGLATLFNRHSRAAPVRSTLEVLWSPVLLIHLAGQDQITAYSIQDNELWGRQVVTLVSQVAIALYVFCQSWSGDRRLLVAAILMFIIGIYKFSTKPWALKRATFGNLVASPPSVAQRKKLSGFRHRFADRWKEVFTKPIGMLRSTPELFLADDIEQCDGWLQAWAEQEEMEATEEELSLREYVEKVQQAADASVSSVFLHETEAFAADLLVPYSRRFKILQFMRNIACKKDRSVSAVMRGLDEVYYRLYTRAKVALTPIGVNLRLLTFSLAVVAIALFARTPKPRDDWADVKVTYILFSSIALLELLSFLNFSTLKFGIVPFPASYADFDLIYQQSLISSAARRRKPSWLLWLAALVSLDDLVMRRWYINQTPGMKRIHWAVLAHITKGWGEYIHGDPALYREFNNLRGQWAVRNHQEVLSYIVNWPFDQSVLIWHVATEMCFHHADTGGGPPRKIAQAISCYMMYLLSARSELLMLGTRRHLFSNSLDDIKIMLQYSDLDDACSDHRSTASAILRTERRGTLLHRDSIGPLIPKACQLAEALLQELQHQKEETWQMVQDVWVEMLCYAASRGRGYMHAVSHGERWELLSHVWLLLCYMGMETLADRLQRAGDENK
ncbi:hypothetical protein C2845_PM18G05240 [Panicum miliaceum]|uniref:DUF4220 domain-containing protein n=1 Tax=Panicum miliaceum TaxID=4540 RepID=A0A3L6PMM8_PANMI|nr:hypothetical protein C2845_PM18G05240 [Panicum miliaceum]